ncbi:MAG TPA: hypothetical protein PK020_12050 [Ilumatobacteraceae bacterium]|nr:hypothetical protein [Ilumatobacteraceae bacterium]HRB04169.1 hypothetical protein [Ilumatobacteraceae bacterium]
MLNDYWQELVTVALLGTDRRDPPTPPTGGLADLAADDPQPTPSQRLLQQVAGCTVVRRAGLLPGAPVATVAPPAHDPRPPTPQSATTTWRRLVGDWPLLEDEWVLAVVRTGRRLAPELVPPVLARYRTDATRHARALAAAGPLGEWMIEWSPRLACTAKRPPVPELVAEVPELPIVPELLPLLSAPAAHVARTLSAGLSSAQLGRSHKAVLVNLVARIQPASLPAVAQALDRVDPSSPSIGLAFALADLAHLRHHMLTELELA